MRLSFCFVCVGLLGYFDVKALSLIGCVKSPQGVVATVRGNKATVGPLGAAMLVYGFTRKVARFLASK